MFPTPLRLRLRLLRLTMKNYYPDDYGESTLFVNLWDDINMCNQYISAP